MTISERWIEIIWIWSKKQGKFIFDEILLKYGVWKGYILQIEIFNVSLLHLFVHVCQTKSFIVVFICLKKDFQPFFFYENYWKLKKSNFTISPLQIACSRLIHLNSLCNLPIFLFHFEKRTKFFQYFIFWGWTNPDRGRKMKLTPWTNDRNFKELKN